jgi:hypothetical protein
LIPVLSNSFILLCNKFTAQIVPRIGLRKSFCMQAVYSKYVAMSIRACAERG